ncbi:MAG: hypothetical protein ACK4WH_02725 [Phycisphaerales bacterium]
MSTSERSREIVALVRKLRSEFGDLAAANAGADLEPVNSGTSGPATGVLGPDQPILNEFVRSMLIWEAGCTKAAAAIRRIDGSCVDLNEFRVCLPTEMVKIIGERYPRVEERCLRLRAALNQLFIREHSLTLQHLASLGKREAREYLEALDGVPRFVSARVCLLCLGGHCAPVDSRILRRLLDAGVVDADATPETAAGLIERSIKAGELLDLYRLLQCAVDHSQGHSGDPPARKPARPAKTATKPAPRRKPAAE